MDFFNRVFDYFLSHVLGGGIPTNWEEVVSLLEFTGAISDIISWARVFAPVTTISILMGLTFAYYGIRFVWAMVKLLKSVIGSNNTLTNLFNSFTGGFFS
jgi:hypothetical protein